MIDKSQEWTINDWYPHAKEKIYLIHKHDLNMIPDGILLISICGEEVIKGKDKIDLDTRFGYLAYGIKE